VGSTNSNIGSARGRGSARPQFTRPGWSPFEIRQEPLVRARTAAARRPARRKAGSRSAPVVLHFMGQPPWASAADHTTQPAQPHPVQHLIFGAQQRQAGAAGRWHNWSTKPPGRGLAETPVGFCTQPRGQPPSMRRCGGKEAVWAGAVFVRFPETREGLTQERTQARKIQAGRSKARKAVRAEDIGSDLLPIDTTTVMALPVTPSVPDPLYRTPPFSWLDYRLARLVIHRWACPWCCWYGRRCDGRGRWCACMTLLLEGAPPPKSLGLAITVLLVVRRQAAGATRSACLPQLLIGGLSVWSWVDLNDDSPTCRPGAPCR